MRRRNTPVAPSCAELMFRLVDPRPLRDAAPYTFYLPSPAALDHAAQGDLVRLMFEAAGPEDDGHAERMWVQVTGRTGETLTGTLDNKPYDIPGLSLGDVLTLDVHHILDIEWADPAKAPEDPDPTEQWLARCLVERAVIEGRAPVGFLFREVPETPEASPYPDSGWCLRPHEEDIGAEEYAAEDIVYVAIGAVLNHDDTFINLLKSPPGTAFERQSDGQFAPVPFEFEDE